MLGTMQPCYYCDRETDGQALVGIPALDAVSWEQVCSFDKGRASRTSHAVLQARREN